MGQDPKHYDHDTQYQQQQQQRQSPRPAGMDRAGNNVALTYNPNHHLQTRNIISRALYQIFPSLNHIPLISRLFQPWVPALSDSDIAILGLNQTTEGGNDRHNNRIAYAGSGRAIVFESGGGGRRRQAPRRANEIFYNQDNSGGPSLFAKFQQEVGGGATSCSSSGGTIKGSRSTSRLRRRFSKDSGHSLNELPAVGDALEDETLMDEFSESEDDSDSLLEFSGDMEGIAELQEKIKAQERKLIYKQERINQHIAQLNTKRKALIDRLDRLDSALGLVLKRRDIYESRLSNLWKFEKSAEQIQNSGIAGDQVIYDPGLNDVISNLGTIGGANSDSVGDEDDIVEDIPRLRSLERVMTGHYGELTSLDYESTLGLIASGGTDTFAKIWNADKGDTRCSIQGHSDIVRSTRFLDNKIITASNDGHIRIWDLSLLDSVQPRSITPLPGQYEDEDYPYGDASTTPLVSPSMCRYVPPMELCCEATLIGHNGAITCMQTGDGIIVSGGADGTIREWDVLTGQLSRSIGVEWATSSGTSDESYLQKAYNEAKMRGGSYKRRFQAGTDSGDGGYVGDLQFFGAAMVTGTVDGIVRLWDRRTSQAHRALRGHKDAITSISFNQNYIISGSLDGTASLWDLRSDQPLGKISLGHEITSVQLSDVSMSGHNDNRAWFVARDNKIYGWNTKSLELTAYGSDRGMKNTCKSFKKAISSPSAFSQEYTERSSESPVITRIKAIDGNRLITGSYDSIKLWKV
ncbi:Mitochondrial fission protein [Mycoemilia scoparia]|uniref:Mitochondrial fission protein n=1 Tax=Mycoemilia scoparia TaxID=417184 RepID=A0A9W8A858_9FUNG|nr:Mitochondrial fission protein [Mycoemilia scoparia]